MSISVMTEADLNHARLEHLKTSGDTAVRGQANSSTCLMESKLSLNNSVSFLLR